MQLYCFPTPRNVCVFALIDHVGAAIERISIDLIKGEHKDAKFAAINPNMKTPALVDGNFKLWEHPAIMLYGVVDAIQQFLFVIRLLDEVEGAVLH